MIAAIVLTTSGEIERIAIECGVVGFLIGGFIGHIEGKGTGEKLRKQIESKMEVEKDPKV
jgi:uncharacterized protein YcfJ